jgi:ABC-type multidrug transport system ATPase subunit
VSPIQNFLHIFVASYHRYVQLDSTSAREVMSAISTLSKAEGMIVVASIHQPSLETLAQFTNVMFLARGAMCYLGRVDQLDQFFEKWGRPVGRFVRPTFFSFIRQIHSSGFA